MKPLAKSCLVAFAAFAADQASKIGIVFGMNLIGVRFIEVLPPYLNFVMGWNTGINFGILGGSGDTARYLLIGLALVISGWLLNWSRAQSGWLMPAAIGLIVGGALGNALDRVLYGAVADFLNMSCCGIRNPYTFNVADIFIFLGAALLVIFSGRDADAKSA